MGPGATRRYAANEMIAWVLLKVSTAQEFSLQLNAGRVEGMLHIEPTLVSKRLWLKMR